jgi:hypothetical protein
MISYKLFLIEGWYAIEDSAFVIHVATSYNFGMEIFDNELEIGILACIRRSAWPEHAYLVVEFKFLFMMADYLATAS